MEKGKFLLITTPRENEILDTLPDLEEQEKLPDNKTEVFRRGLHAVRQLVEVDEKPLLELLVATLEKSKANLNKENIDEVKALAYAVHATLIAKRGIIGAEIFESVPLTCSYLDFIEGDKIDRKEVTKTLEDLAISIKTLILRNSTNNAPRSNSKKIRLENKQSVKRLTV